MDLRVYKYGEDVLRQKSEKIEDFNEELAELADEMYRMMKEEDGIGLAAPQIGKSIRLVVINTRDRQSIGRLNLVNPEIVSKSNDLVVMEEGCLSIPRIYANVKRPASVKLRAQNLKGGDIEINAKGMLARVIQHEVDHLDGILFIDKIKDKDKKKIQYKLNDIKKEVSSA